MLDRKSMKVAAILLAVIAFGWIAGCVKSGETLVRAPLPVVVSVDGTVEKTLGRVWEKGDHGLDDQMKKEILGPIYDEQTKEWFNQKNQKNVRVIIDTNEYLWVAAESSQPFSREFNEKYPQASAVSMQGCGVDDVCNIVLRVSKEAVNADNIQDLPEDNWYEFRATIPSHKKEYEAALQDDPHVVAYAFIRVDFDEDGVSAQYIREGFVNSEEPLEIQPLSVD